MPFLDIPSSLPKSITVHILRANQLEIADPLMFYFNILYAIEQILNQNLHNFNESISKFVINLLDKVESFKNDESNVTYIEILNDKLISVAYIMNFTNKIFFNSLKQIQNHSSNKNTALNLLITINFYDLLKLWKSDENFYESIQKNEEILKKIKYAKFHATRIIKSIKNNENPNEYNPLKLNFKKIDEEYNISNDIISNDDDDDDDNNNNNNSNNNNDNNELKPIISQENHSNDSFKEIKKSFKKEINVNEFLESSKLYSKAQKHAKFAISAMNYEDKETTLKELQNAIELINQLKS